jgi:hypothetical protein
MKMIGLLLAFVVGLTGSFFLGAWWERQLIVASVTNGPDSDNIGPALTSIEAARQGMSEGNKQTALDGISEAEKHLQAIDEWFDLMRDHYR